MIAPDFFVQRAITQPQATLNDFTLVTLCTKKVKMPFLNSHLRTASLLRTFGGGVGSIIIAHTDSRSYYGYYGLQVGMGARGTGGQGIK